MMAPLDITPAKVCNRCREAKPQNLEHFASDARRACRLNSTCRRCQSERAKAWYRANTERARENTKAWSRRNPDRVAEHWRAKRAGRSMREGYRTEDEAHIRACARQARSKPEQRLVRRLRERVREACNGGPCRALLGCTAAQLRQHIERQFQKGMTWENRGEWHVDHILPLASFDLTDPAQRLRACHFTNLRPLWADENLAKAAKRILLL